MAEWISKRALSAKEKGRKGGIATARNHDPEFLEQRASKAGTKTRDTYGIGYYRYLRTLRGKIKTPKEKIIQSIIPDSPVPETSTELMIAAAKTIA
jgi:general stress protein YciG